MTTSCSTIANSLKYLNARGCRALVMVHCEGYDAIKFMTERLELAGNTSPFYHAVSRSTEREATHRAISHSELLDVPIMIGHISGRQAMEQVRWAQQRGLQVYGETCPQYVTLTADDLKGLNMDDSGGKYVCSPLPRDRASWRIIARSIFKARKARPAPRRAALSAGSRMESPGSRHDCQYCGARE